MKNKYDLDVDSPDKVADVLRYTAEAFYDSAAELESTWQDKKSGNPWKKIALILEQAANKIEKI